jgi:hypothetical protein
MYTDDGIVWLDLRIFEPGVAIGSFLGPVSRALKAPFV